MFAKLIIKNISMRVYLTNFLSIQVFFVSFCSFFLHALASISLQYYTNYCYHSNSSISTIITIIIVSAIKNLPLLLVFLFFLLLILSYLLAIVFNFQCYNSHQVKTTITVSIISFVNFLVNTFDLHLLISVSHVFF